MRKCYLSYPISNSVSVSVEEVTNQISDQAILLVNKTTRFSSFDFAFLGIKDLVLSPLSLVYFHTIQFPTQDQQEIYRFVYLE